MSHYTMLYKYGKRMRVFFFFSFFFLFLFFFFFFDVFIWFDLILIFVFFILGAFLIIKKKYFNRACCTWDGYISYPTRTHGIILKQPFTSFTPYVINSYSLLFYNRATEWKFKAAVTRQTWVGKLVLANFKKLVNSYLHTLNSRHFTTHGNLQHDRLSVVALTYNSETEEEKRGNRDRWRNRKVWRKPSLSASSSIFFCLFLWYLCRLQMKCPRQPDNCEPLR